MIQVGDRVVCVDARKTAPNRNVGYLREGVEYVVHDKRDGHCFQLVDIGLPSLCHGDFVCPCGVKYHIPGDSHWYRVNRFRKVEERTIEYTVKVDIEIPEPILS